MFIHDIKIKNIRSIKSLHWNIPTEHVAGWHVVIGDNGAGKSSFLRALALAFIGAEEAPALWQDWDTWLRRGAKEGSIAVELFSNPRQSGGQNEIPETASSRIEFKQGSFEAKSTNIFGSGIHFNLLFAVAFGPYRRFGGNRIAGSGDVLWPPNTTRSAISRLFSLFDENVALVETLEWLQNLKFRQLERVKEADMLLNAIQNFINQSGMLPHGARLHDISSRRILFIDGNGSEIAIEELSDGFRSILSMTFEIIRQMAIVYSPEYIFDAEDATRIVIPGIVLIDEIDVHLHPTWQRSVGLWFRKHFPNIQFIVTTHSPLVCQAADVGTVFRLPTPGSDEKGRMLKGQDLNRLIYGNVLDAFSTSVFGSDVTRSDKSREKLQRLAELNQAELSRELNSGEYHEQQALRTIFSTDANVL